ncbi:MAG: SDR family oxidoreductase [Solirubrobacteraceae bacterium]
MRVYVTGGSGFVGSHLVRAFDDVLAPTHAEVDLTDSAAVARSVAAFEPDAIVHAAILNDLGRLYADRRAGWDAYVGATRNVVDAAAGAHVVLVSTDWVFDGTKGGATEDTPPNPVNLYGFLKAASEVVVIERAARGAVARIAGVQGFSRAPRRQDAGFGYLVSSIVQALRAGERFTVWESPAINMIATPTYAGDAAELIARIVAGGHTGIFHCCGGEASDRAALARRTVDAFGLDGDLLAFGPPDAPPEVRVPYDTSLDARATAAALGVELPDLDTMLGRLERS